MPEDLRLKTGMQINLDMHALKSDLSRNVDPEAEITKVCISSKGASQLTCAQFFLAKLQVSKDIYKHLTLLLETYVEQVAR